jgi:hypothetical protein
MNKELLKLLLDSLERLVLAYLKYEGKIDAVPDGTPVPEPEPEPVVNVPEDPDEDVPDKPADNQQPGQPVVSTNQAKLYVPRDRRQEWIDKLANEYSVWRGEREYSEMLEPKYKDYVAKRIAGVYTFGGIRTLMRWAQESHAKSQRLQHRIDKEIHRKFRDRSQVRKSVVNEMRDELKKRSEEYATVAALFPAVKGCDSIRCKLRKKVK